MGIAPWPPIVDEGNWNAVVGHGLTKAASFIIRKSSGYIEAIDGKTGRLEYGGSEDVGGIDGTDAGAVLQACHDVLTSGGRIHFILDSYTYKTKVTITQRIMVTGEGYNTIFQASTSPALNDDLLFINDTDWVVFRDFRIDGNSASQTAGSGIKIHESSNCHFQNVWSTDCKEDGWEITGTTWSNWAGLNTFIDCRAYDNQGRGFYSNYTVDNDWIRCVSQDNVGYGWLTYGVQWCYRCHPIRNQVGWYVNGAGTTFVECYFDDSDRHGVEVHADNVRFTECYVYYNGSETNNTYDGIMCDGNNLQVVGGRFRSRETGTERTRYAINCSGGRGHRIIGTEFRGHNNHAIRMSGSELGTIQGNTIHDNDTHGIYFNECEDMTIQGNPIYNNGGSGISMYLSNFIVIIGNPIKGNGRITATNDGVRLVTCDDCTIEGNVIRWNPRSQIRIENSGCNRTQVHKNRLDKSMQSGSDAIDDNGTNSDIADNKELTTMARLTSEFTIGV